MAIVNYTTTSNLLKMIDQIQAVVTKPGACNVSTAFKDDIAIVINIAIPLSNEVLNFKVAQQG